MGLCKSQPWAIEQKELEVKGYKFDEKGNCIYDPNKIEIKEELNQLPRAVKAKPKEQRVQEKSFEKTIMKIIKGKKDKNKKRGK